MDKDWPYPNFSKKEMACKCGCGKLPEPRFMEILQAIRTEAGFPIIVTSGARCSTYNRLVSDSGNMGPHVQGLAADVRLYGERAIKLIEFALKYGMTGIGLSQKGPFGSRFVHVDCLSELRPWIWSY